MFLVCGFAGAKVEVFSEKASVLRLSPQGVLYLLVAKGTQNHPHVAFAGSEFGDAKTGAFAGLRRKGMRRFDCGGSAKQALLSPAGRRCEQTGPVFNAPPSLRPFSAASDNAEAQNGRLAAAVRS